MSLYSVVAGNTALAGDLNQFLNVLTGLTTDQIVTIGHAGGLGFGVQNTSADTSGPGISILNQQTSHVQRYNILTTGTGDTTGAGQLLLNDSTAYKGIAARYLSGGWDFAPNGNGLFDPGAGIFNIDGSLTVLQSVNFGTPGTASCVGQMSPAGAQLSIGADVNGVGVSSARFLRLNATGPTTGVTIEVDGSQANTDLRLAPHGTGVIDCAYAAVAGNTTTLDGDKLAIKVNGVTKYLQLYSA